MRQKFAQRWWHPLKIMTSYCGQQAASVLLGIWGGGGGMYPLCQPIPVCHCISKKWHTHTHICKNAKPMSSHAHLEEPGCLCTKQALGACVSKLLENGLGTRRRTSYLLTASGVGTRSPTWTTAVEWKVAVICTPAYARYPFTAGWTGGGGGRQGKKNGQSSSASGGTRTHDMSPRPKPLHHQATHTPWTLKRSHPIGWCSSAMWQIKLGQNMTSSWRPRHLTLRACCDTTVPGDVLPTPEVPVATHTRVRLSWVSFEKGNSTFS